MSNWQHRLTQYLEPVLMADDPRPGISAYHDMPYAIFRYEPEHEFAVRAEVALLRTRLEQAGKRVTTISLARCLQDALDREKLTTKRIMRAEKSTGTAKMVEVVSRRPTGEPDFDTDVHEGKMECQRAFSRSGA